MYTIVIGVIKMKILVKAIRQFTESEYKEKRNGNCNS